MFQVHSIPSVDKMNVVDTVFHSCQTVSILAHQNVSNKIHSSCALPSAKTGMSAYVSNRQHFVTYATMATMVVGLTLPSLSIHSCIFFKKSLSLHLPREYRGEKDKAYIYTLLTDGEKKKKKVRSCRDLNSDLWIQSPRC